MSKTCQYCKFFNPRTGETHGNCQFDPPAVDVLPAPIHRVGEAKVITRWPLTSFNDWCGKFLPYDEVEEEDEEDTANQFVPADIVNMGKEFLRDRQIDGSQLTDLSRIEPR